MTGLLHPSESNQKETSGALTSVGHMWNAPKCDYVAVISLNLYAS
jgi:hypothetical protein